MSTPEGERPPTEEEMRAALEEQMKKITVPDVIFQTVATLVNLAARKLEDDAEQTKLGIEAVRALMPLLPEKETEPVKQALSQLQMAYVRATQGGEGAKKPTEEEERARARAKIWTPGGSADK